MRYFIKKNAAGEVVAFGRGGKDGEEITRGEYERLRQETAERIEREIAKHQAEDFREVAEPVGYAERLEALEAAVLGLALGAGSETRFFVAQIELGKLTLEQVPEKWQKAVDAALLNKRKED